jgi:hypothetical protein
VKKVFISSFLMIGMLAFDADAAVKVKNSTVERYGAQIEQDADEAAIIATLQEDIRILDEEIAKCKKQKKGWIAATVVGSAGVVATGVAAGVQGAKIKDKKDELGEKRKELESLRSQGATITTTKAE